ncbi:putative nuclease HARBI1 [Eupeodes corollae]|uniref:putative nuclease HARBI1 n=1 Tax=Eupeodes corollae TaxID=290404 RepID=UPI002490223D|nr:putative nuclease HARBI1 [Eupeodes corollae]
MNFQNNNEDEDDLMLTTIIASASVFLSMITKRNKKLPSIRVSPYLLNRQTKGRFATDFNDMEANEKVFKENFHMPPNIFRELFSLVEPKLCAVRNTRPEDEITPLEKFAIVIEYLASGSIQRHVSSVYRISKQDFGKILDDVCIALCEVLVGYIPKLDAPHFVEIANQFNIQWNLPNCIGAIDGKHVAIKCPQNAGSLFYNYKGFHSIVLMAIADANYKFVYIDVGAHGSEGDANVFASTNIGKATLQDNLPFPEDMVVGNEKLPFFFVADDAFPLCKRIVKPYAPSRAKKLANEERIANYRISRARRCVENSFGILSCKWLCLSRTMFCNPDRAQKIISACCFIHNYLITNNKETYCPSKMTDYYDETGC